MLLEAVDRPIRYTWPEGELRLRPGKPIEVPDDRGQKVLARCGSKVRRVSPDWLAAWRELAQMTDGIQKTDDCFAPVMAALDRCDLAFECRDWSAFQREVELLRRLCPKQPSHEAKSALGKEELGTPITVGSSVFYRLPGKPEVGPCRVTLLDEGWHLAQIVENGKWVWVHRCLITRVQIGNG